MEGVAPILHRLASACRRLDAVRGVPLRAGAGLLAYRGYRGSGRAADWGARGVRAQWRPSPGAAAFSGGGRGSLGPVLSVYFFSILFMPCLPGDMPQGTDNAQPPLNTDSPLHWEVQQHWEEIEAEIARHPPSPPSPPSSPPTPHDAQETHEQQAFRLGRNIPAFLDRDLVDSFRPIYLVADFLFRTNHPVQFGLKHCLYQLLLPPAVYWEWRFITYPPALQHFILQHSLGQ